MARIELDEWAVAEAREAVAYLRAVFPGSGEFDQLVAEGARGDEVHTITGDDLAGACHYLQQLMNILQVEGYRAWALEEQK